VGRLLGGIADRQGAGGPRSALALATALLFAGCTWRWGWRAELAAYLYFAALSVVLSVIDVRTHRLPNRLTFTAYPTLLALLALPAVTQPAYSAYGRAMLAGITLMSAFITLHLLRPSGLGLGDVKLAGVMGIALGWISWTTVFTGAVIGFLLGAIGALTLIAARRANRRSALPFGPFLLAGAWAAILATS
jgi:leader peptidase (prepilin peptidase)/N-methyltransferase